MTSKKWYVVQRDSREDFGTAKAFNSVDSLAALLTNTWLPTISRLPLRGKATALKRRYTPELHNATVYTPRFQGACLNSFSRRSSHDWDRWLRDGQKFGNWATRRLKKIGLRQGEGVFGYTAASLEPLQYAYEVGGVGVLGQVSPGFVWHKILREESEKWGVDTATKMPSQHYVDRVKSEWDMAKFVVVNSHYSKACLMAEGVVEEKLIVAEPPLALTGAISRPKIAPAKNEPLRVLFVGSLSLVKGIQYLGAAASELVSGSFSFTAVGNDDLPEDFLKKMRWPVKHIKHQTRESLDRLYSSHHVLVFPSLCDGFGLVQVEAQARGLPVIATSSCGSVVRDGVSGFLVPPFDSAAIVSRLEQLRGMPELLESMSLQAIKEVTRFTPENYAKHLMKPLEAT